MTNISERLNPSPKYDQGHYVDCPVPSGERTIEVLPGTGFEQVYLLGDNPAIFEDVPCKIAVGKQLPFDSIVVNAHSKVNVVILVMPGFDIDMPIAVDIVGEGAEVKVSGMYISGGKERVSIRTEIRHRVPYGTSYQLFNGIAAGQADIHFYGKIIVAPDAQKTEAYQTNHNIVLSESARAESKPQLEIYADDVKCSHGATVGQLNDDEQFYMRSRGIPADEAKVLQMISFIAPVLADISDQSCREYLDTLIENAVRHL